MLTQLSRSLESLPRKKVVASVASIAFGAIAMFTSPAHAGMIISGPYTSIGTAGNALRQQK